MLPPTRRCATRCAQRREIWAHAAAHGLALVTKDDDFEELSVLRGAPPKLVMIGLGNCTTVEVASLLRHHAGELAKFALDPVGSVIELPPPSGGR